MKRGILSFRLRVDVAVASRRHDVSGDDKDNDDDDGDDVGGCLAGLIGVVRIYVERHNVLITMASNPNVPTVQCQVQCALCLT